MTGSIESWDSNDWKKVLAVAGALVALEVLPEKLGMPIAALSLILGLLG